MTGRPLPELAEGSRPAEAGALDAPPVVARRWAFSLDGASVVPADGLQAGQGHPHRRTALARCQSPAVVVVDGRVGDARPRDGLPRAPEVREEDEQERPEEGEADPEEPRQRVEQRRDADQDGLPQRRRRDGGQVDVSQDELVDELGPHPARPLVDAPKRDAREHAVAVEPVRVDGEVFVVERVGAVAHILAAEELVGDVAVVAAGCQRGRSIHRGEIAGQEAIDSCRVSVRSFPPGTRPPGRTDDFASRRWHLSRTAPAGAPSTRSFASTRRPCTTWLLRRWLVAGRRRHERRASQGLHGPEPVRTGDGIDVSQAGTADVSRPLSTRPVQVD